MGGGDEVDRLRAGDYGFKGGDRMFKWINRLFDCMINVLFQASYKIYKICRDRELGNLETLNHGEFNERVIDHYLNNNRWRLEKEKAPLGRRVSLRDVTAKSSAPQHVDIDFTKRHDMASNKVSKDKPDRTNYICAMCRIEPLEEPYFTRAGPCTAAFNALSSQKRLN